MTIRSTRFASSASLAAALCMCATPAAALDLPVVHTPATEYGNALPADAGEANQYRRYRGHRNRHRDRGIDAGDVVAGVVVLGALAAILSSSNNDRDRYDDRRTRARYDDRRRNYESRGVEGAVDMCVDQVEYRGNGVDAVDRADRTASGWTVSGMLENGERWTCFIDNGGQIRSVDYGGVAYSRAPAASGAGQLSDDAYRNARATTRTAADEVYRYDDRPAAGGPVTGGPQPAYPGGPLPGEEGYDSDWRDDSEWEGDGRYTTAQAPDFDQDTR